MTDFKALSQTVQRMQADGVQPAQINEWLSQAGTDLATLNASGYGPNPTSAERPGKGASFAQGAGEGLSMGFNDELVAALTATGYGPVMATGMQGPDPSKFGQNYETTRDTLREAKAEHKEANPKSYMAGEIVGSVAPAIVAPEAYGSNFIANAPTMGNMMLRSGLTGAGFGGASAFGHAEGTPEEQAKQTAIGTGTGAVIGAAAPPIIKGATNAVKWVWNKAAGMFTPAEQVVEAAPAVMQRGPMPPAQPAQPVQAQPGTMPPPQVPPGMQQAPQVPQTPLQARPVTSFDDVRPRASASVSLSDKSKAINEVARALQRDGYSIDQIEQAINSLGPEATIADLGDATQRLLRTQKSAPGAAGNIIKTSLNNRQVGEQGRLLDSVQKALGTKAGVYETDDVLLQRLDDEARPFYEKAFAEPREVNVAPILEQIDKSLSKVPTKSPIRRAVESVRSMLGDMSDDVPMTPGGNSEAAFKPYSDLETLHNAKLAIDDMLSNFGGENSLGKVSKAKVMEIKTALLNAMDEASPDYATARKSFSGIMSGKDALEAGRSFIREDAEAIGRRLAEMPVEDQELYRIGGLRAIKDIIGSKPNDVSVVQLLRKSNLLDKVRELVPSEEAFNNYVRELENARRFAETRATALGGSQSVEKALDAADQSINLGSAMTDVATGNKGGITSRLMDWVGGKFNNMVGPGEDARAKIAQILVSTDPAQRGDALKAIAAAMAQQQAVKQGAGVIGSVGASQAGPAGGAYWRGRQQ